MHWCSRRATSLIGRPSYTHPKAFAPNPVPHARPVLPSRRASSSATSAPTMEGHRNPTSTGGIPGHTLRGNGVQAAHAPSSPVITRHHTLITHQPRTDTPEYGVSSPKVSCCTNTPLASMRRGCEHAKGLRRRSACAGQHAACTCRFCIQPCSRVALSSSCLARLSA